VVGKRNIKFKARQQIDSSNCVAHEKTKLSNEEICSFPNQNGGLTQLIDISETHTTETCRENIKNIIMKRKSSEKKEI